MTDLNREAAFLRHMVEREDFAAVQRSLDRYVTLVEEERSLPALAQARDLIEWARRSLCAARSRLSQDRDRLQGVAQYREATEPASHFQIDG